MTREIFLTNIDNATWKKVETVLEDKGISITDAVSLLLKQIALEQDFEIPHIPNAETIAAFEQSMRNEDIYTANSVEELFDHLDRERKNDD